METRIGRIELMCLPIGSFYFCFLYKKQGYIFLHLGSARNKQTNIRNHGGKKTRGKHWRNQRSPMSKFTFRHPVIHLYPTLQRASCARWLKTSAGPELNGKERPGSLQGEKAEFGERELPSQLPWGPEQKCRASQGLPQLKATPARTEQVC